MSELDEVDLEGLATLLDRDAQELRGWGGRSFRRDIGLDSLELLEIALLLEDAVDATLPDGLVAELDTLLDVLACLRAHGSGR